MNNTLRTLLTQWNVCRIVRIVAGLPILIVGIVRGDWPSILFGAAFLAAGLFSTQCCSAGSCATPNTSKERSLMPIEYEEIKRES